MNDILLYYNLYHLPANGSVRFDGFKDIQIVLVAFGAYLTVFDGGFDGATGLVTMCAVGKMTVVQHLAHLGKEVR